MTTPPPPRVERRSSVFIPDEEIKLAKSLPFLVPKTPDGLYFFNCPHCGAGVTAESWGLNCQIFRCGVWKKSYWTRDGTPPVAIYNMKMKQQLEFELIQENQQLGFVQEREEIQKRFQVMKSQNFVISSDFYLNFIRIFDQNKTQNQIQIQNKENKTPVLDIKSMEFLEKQTVVVSAFSEIPLNLPASNITLGINQGWIHPKGSYLPPHAAKALIDKWKQFDLFSGCGKPFRFDGKSPPVGCDYI